MNPAKSFYRILCILSTAMLAIGLLSGAAAANASLIYDHSPSSFSDTCGICGSGTTFGWSFTLSSSITVDGLGVWDGGSTGLLTDVQAGLWTGTGTLLASTTVTNASGTPEASAASSLGRWLVNTIPAMTLAPGNYVLGATFVDGEIGTYFNYMTIAEITNVAGLVGSQGGGLEVPGNSFAVPVNGPTLRIGNAQVPEPATLALFTLGLAGFAAGHQRKVAQQASVACAV